MLSLFEQIFKQKIRKAEKEDGNFVCEEFAPYESNLPKVKNRTEETRTRQGGAQDRTGQDRHEKKQLTQKIHEHETTET